MHFPYYLSTDIEPLSKLSSQNFVVNNMVLFAIQGIFVLTAVIAQLAARRSHNPKVVSSILTHRISLSVLGLRLSGFQAFRVSRFRVLGFRT